jgi:hypothetical protein
MESMRGMEETTMLLESIGKHFEEHKNPDAAKAFYYKARIPPTRPRSFMTPYLSWSNTMKTCGSTNRERIRNNHPMPNQCR